MARAAWGLTAALLLITGAVMAQNSRLKNDNAELSEQLLDAEEERAALQRLASRSSRGPDRAGRADGAGRPPERARENKPTPEDLLAEIPVEDLLNTSGIEHQLQAVVAERVKEEIGNQRAERMDRRRAELGELIAEYSEDADLSEDTREDLIAVMEDSIEDAANILSAHRQNHSTSEQAREHMAALQEVVYNDVTELLGEDEAAIFLETVHGPLKPPSEP